MSKYFKLSAALLSLAMAGTVVAQEAAAPAATPAPEIAATESVSKDWHLNVGLSYRSFKDPKFKSAKSPSATAAYFTSDVALNAEPLNEFFSQTIPSPNFVNIIQNDGGSSYSHGDYGDGESLGFILGAEYTLWGQDGFTLSLAGNFQYFELDSASKGGWFNSTETTSTYGTYALERGVVPTPGMGLTPEPLDGPFSSNVLNGYSRTEFDMDLYIFDLGASLAYEFECGLSLKAAVGPTLTLADMNSKSVSTIDFGGTTKDTDDDFEVNYGYYLSCGVAYWFNEKYGLSLDVRYDKGFGGVGTKYVSQNLDAWGGSLKFLCRF